MAVKIRLRREGRKKTPMYRIIVADSKSPRDGRFIEILGQYQPRGGENAIALRADRVNHWLDVGALPTDTVRSLLRRAGIFKARHEVRLATKLQAVAVPLVELAPEADAAQAAVDSSETEAETEASAADDQAGSSAD